VSNLYTLTTLDLVVIITVKSVCLIVLIIDIIIYLFVTYILSKCNRIQAVLGGGDAIHDGMMRDMEGRERGRGRGDRA
jgi:hypothetical protein